MQKTTNYNLNKPEATDPLRVADFNANADLIDAALASKAEKSAVTAVETALVKKADTSAVTAVETALANYKASNDAAVASVTQNANAAYSASNPPLVCTTIDTSGFGNGDIIFTFPQTPQFVILQGLYGNVLMRPGDEVIMTDYYTQMITREVTFQMTNTSLIMTQRNGDDAAKTLTIVAYY